VISIIFLPLTFLCGVYGMNLKIPEAEWPYSYAAFWVVVIVIVVGLVTMMKRKKWI
jgi:magnesium transporter